MSKSIHLTRSEFIEKIGLMAQADGMPRIFGRMLGLFIWDGEAVAFGDLAEKLQISRGSISSSTRILEERRLIKRVAKPGERQDYFQLADNPYVKMVDYYIDGLEQAKSEIGRTLAEIPDEEQAVKARVQAYAEFYDLMSQAVSKLAADLKAS